MSATHLTHKQLAQTARGRRRVEYRSALFARKRVYSGRIPAYRDGRRSSGVPTGPGALTRTGTPPVRRPGDWSLMKAMDDAHASAYVTQQRRRRALARG